MSIYSGLPTREDQRNYNSLMVKLLQTLQEHILHVTNGIIEPKFANKYQKIIGKMETYEEHKYLPPKYTTILAPLLRTIYHSRNKLLGDISSINEKNKHGLEAVKEEEEMPSARQIQNKRSAMSTSYKKNKSEAGIDGGRKLKKQQFYHESNRTNPMSNTNRRSCSVFAESKNTKMGKIIQNHLLVDQDNSIKQEEQSSAMNYSEDYFKRKKNLRTKMYLQKNPRNKPIFSGEAEIHEKLFNATQQRRIMTEESKNKPHPSVASRNYKINREIH